MLYTRSHFSFLMEISTAESQGTGFDKSSGSLESQKQSVSTKHCCVSHSPSVTSIAKFQLQTGRMSIFHRHYGSTNVLKQKHRIISDTHFRSVLSVNVFFIESFSHTL